MITIEKIVDIAKYFTVIAHTPGRLRVRVSPKIQQENSTNVTLSEVENLASQIDGIQSIKIKKIIASITIIYDPKIFEPRLWNDLINRENLEEVSSVINKLIKEVV